MQKVYHNRDDFKVSIFYTELFLLLLLFFSYCKSTLREHTCNPNNQDQLSTRYPNWTLETSKYIWSHPIVSPKFPRQTCPNSRRVPNIPIPTRFLAFGRMNWQPAIPLVEKSRARSLHFEFRMRWRYNDPDNRPGSLKPLVVNLPRVKYQLNVAFVPDLPCNWPIGPTDRSLWTGNIFLAERNARKARSILSVSLSRVFVSSSGILRHFL